MVSVYAPVLNVGMSITKASSNGLTLVSLFSGCGGSSLGYHIAGYDVKLAVEWDTTAAAVYRLNFPGTPVYEGDIALLSGQEALQLADLNEGELSVLDGSPPCQGFSTAGKRQFSDSRNRLFEEYIRLLSIFKPKALIMENVSGLVKGKMKLNFAKMTSALKDAGYVVSCRLLNAWWYGVPQNRERLIWIGFREDLQLQPTHPQPYRERPITASQALQDIKALPYDRDFLDTKIGQAMMTVRPGQCDGHHYGHIKLHPDKPCPTLQHNFLSWFHTWHWAEHRPLRVSEWKALHGFPECFRFPEREQEACPLIGNSVPPPLAEAVGRHVAMLLNKVITCPV